jgi:hypothetical protein
MAHIRSSPVDGEMPQLEPQRPVPTTKRAGERTMFDWLIPLLIAIVLLIRSWAQA